MTLTAGFYKNLQQDLIDWLKAASDLEEYPTGPFHKWFYGWQTESAGYPYAYVEIQRGDDTQLTVKYPKAMEIIEIHVGVVYREPDRDTAEKNAMDKAVIIRNRLESDVTLNSLVDESWIVGFETERGFEGPRGEGYSLTGWLWRLGARVIIS